MPSVITTSLHGALGLVENPEICRLLLDGQLIRLQTGRSVFRGEVAVVRSSCWPRCGTMRPLESFQSKREERQLSILDPRQLCLSLECGAACYSNAYSIAL